jgi:hypothetical protein
VPSTATIKDDSVVLGAVKAAEAAARVEAPTVGENLGAYMESENVAVHRFVCTDPGYVGWTWAVTVARAPRSKTPTICDVVLLPGDGALVAPAWVPWSERIRPGDLGVGDVLPTSRDDPRLVPGYSGEADVDGAAGEEPLGVMRWVWGVGRARVLSSWGRDIAADRWDVGDFGPHAEMAQAASMHCGTCGFIVTIGGPLGQGFGVCANEMSPADGRMVSVGYGCGAHSQVAIDVVPTMLVPTMLTEREEDVAVELGHS